MNSTDATNAENSPPDQRRGRGRQWQKGESGNPAGKPRGTRHKVTMAVEALLDGEADALTRKAIEKAKEGDVTALRLCLDRIAPARRDRHVVFRLPALSTPADTVKAAAAVVAAVAAGDLTPGEAAEVSKVIDMFTRALETHDHAERIARLEAVHR